MEVFMIVTGAIAAVLVTGLVDIPSTPDASHPDGPTSGPHGFPAVQGVKRTVMTSPSRTT